MKIEHPLPGIVHVKYDTQEELTRAFVRMAEFYESPYPDIRGHYFTLDQFRERYIETHGAWTYYTDWHGFNMPSHAVTAFSVAFAGDRMTPEEVKLIDAVITNTVQPCYLIGTHQEEDVTHEIAHALYSIDARYAHDVRNLLFKFVNTDDCFALRAWLLREGYSDAVMLDEYNAYLSTNDLAEFLKDFPPEQAQRLYAAGEPFRDLFIRTNYAARLA